MVRRVNKVEPFLSESAFTEKTFFEYLRTLTSYAHGNSTESSIYGAIGFILSVFCSSAAIDGGSVKNLQLSSFPQKSLKANKRYRAPDFAALVTQFREFGQTFSDSKTMGKTSILIWEVKLQKYLNMPWFPHPSTRRNPQLFHIFPDFITHLPQIVEQAAFARFQCDSKSVFTLLSVDVWFAFFHFPGGQSARFLEQFMTKDGEATKATLDHSDYCKVLDCCVIAPSPIFKNRCRAFKPEFLYVLDHFATSLQIAAEVQVTTHSMFRLREGNILESNSLKTNMENFKEAVLVHAGQLRRDNALALGTEPPGAGTPQTSFTEDSDTGSDKYPATRPSHVTPSGVQTRSKSRAQTTEGTLRDNVGELPQPAASEATSAMASGSGSGHHGRERNDHMTVRAEGSSRPRRPLNAQSGDSG